MAAVALRASPLCLLRTLGFYRSLRAFRTLRTTLASCLGVTTLQAVTWAGAARRIPRTRNSAGRQYARYCALGQGCKDPKPLRPTSSCSVLAGVLTYWASEKPLSKECSVAGCSVPHWATGHWARYKVPLTS